MNNPLLSICIPTYNRAPFLRQCLDSITAQFTHPAVLEQVEIVLSDNGSSDGTAETVAEYQKKFANIFYSRNAENVGVDKNILKVVNQAHGEYCWFLGDDDALFKDSLNYILPILAGRKFDYLLANAWGYDRQLEHQALSRPNLHLEKNLEYGELALFVRSISNYTNIVGYFGGFSCQIVKRTVWQAALGKEQFVGKQALHLFVVLSAFKLLPTCILAKPLVKVRADNMRWDTFPGLETVRRRAASTKETQEWIFKLYGIRYSKIRLEAAYVWAVGYGWLYNFTRTHVLKSQRVRNFFKKIFRI